MVHDDLTTHTTRRTPVTATAPLNHLPHGAAEHRALLLFGLDLVDRLGVMIVGIDSASHSGLSIHAECRHAADALADALGLPPEAPKPDADQRGDYYARTGVTDVPGLAPRVIARVYGPRDWDYRGLDVYPPRTTCACGREVDA
jgi:hypothetical protein